MRLEYLLKEINEAAYQKIVENQKANGEELSEEEARGRAAIVGLAALKYGDLSNQSAKDYIFDIERFVSFEGNTGPYILYVIVRIKSILAKYAETGKNEAEATKICPAVKDSEKALMLTLIHLQEVLEMAYKEIAPYKICQYIYELANVFNSFYHDTKIISEENEMQQKSWIALLKLTKKTLEACIELLGFQAPDRM